LLKMYRSSSVESINRAVARSLFMNAARVSLRESYCTVADGRFVSVQRNTMLRPKGDDEWPQMVVCLELTWAASGTMRCVAAAEPHWVADLIPRIHAVDVPRLIGPEGAKRLAQRERAAELAVASVRVEKRVSDAQVEAARERALARKKARGVK
jgi:hypothetical protein